MRVAVTGSTGLVGEALIAAMSEHGHEPVRVVRQVIPDELPNVGWDPARGEIDSDALEGIHALVHLAGESIGASRWSDDQKARILDSRVNGTTLISRTVAGLDDGPGVLISSSAIGYYGDRGTETLTEESGPGSGFVSDVCTAWERSTTEAEAAGLRVVHARSGIVLSPRGGALAKQLPFFRLGLGGRLGSGQQWMSWVSLPDAVAALLWMLDTDVSGAVNVTSPHPVTNADFTKTLGRVLRRPTPLPTPRLAVRARLGRQLSDELLYASAKVMPRMLLDRGFEFEHPELEPALRHVLGRP